MHACMHSSRIQMASAAAMYTLNGDRHSAPAMVYKGLRLLLLLLLLHKIRAAAASVLHARHPTATDAAVVALPSY